MVANFASQDQPDSHRNKAEQEQQAVLEGVFGGRGFGADSIHHERGE